MPLLTKFVQIFYRCTCISMIVLDNLLYRYNQCQHPHQLATLPQPHGLLVLLHTVEYPAPIYRHKINDIATTIQSYTQLCMYVSLCSKVSPHVSIVTWCFSNDISLAIQLSFHTLQSILHFTIAIITYQPATI